MIRLQWFMFASKTTSEPFSGCGSLCHMPFHDFPDSQNVKTESYLSIHNSPMSHRPFPDFFFVGKLCKANLPLSSVATSGATTPSAQVCKKCSTSCTSNSDFFDQITRMMLPQACQVITLYSVDRPRSVSGGTPQRANDFESRKMASFLNDSIELDDFPNQNPGEANSLNLFHRPRPFSLERTSLRRVLTSNPLQRGRGVASGVNFGSLRA